jgi:hypothetical protein
MELSGQFYAPAALTPPSPEKVSVPAAQKAKAGWAQSWTGRFGKPKNFLRLRAVEIWFVFGAALSLITVIDKAIAALSFTIKI